MAVAAEYPISALIAALVNLIAERSISGEFNESSFVVALDPYCARLDDINES
jgi:hypothetical protein